MGAESEFLRAAFANAPADRRADVALVHQIYRSERP